ATGSSLVLTHVQLGDAGAYAVVVSNSAGTATSANAVLTVNPPPPCAPTPSGLVGWWAGEGNANDSTGANNGLLEGGMTFVTGEVGQAFNFNGDDADVRVTANPSLDVGLGAGFTIEAWIKPADLSALRPIVEWNSVTGFVPYGVHFWTSQPSPWGGTGPGCLYANLVDTAGVSHPFSSAGNLLTTSAFQHVALTYVKATGLAVIYLNGSAVAQANLGSFTPQTSSDLYLGYRPSSLAIVYRWVGQMDEVSLYNRALSTAEIQAIYSASVSGKCSLAPVIVSQPQDQAVVLGTTATFSVTASGTPPLTYQWQLNSNNIPGATGSSLVLTHVQLGDAGAYAVVVSNSAGTATSANAVLTGNTLDDAGGNTGLSKGGLSFAEAEVGQGFVFNGTDAYVKVPANSSLNVGLGAGFTIEAWINPADLSLPRPLVEWNSGAGFAPYGVHFWISQPLPYGNGPGCLFANLIDTTGGTHWFPSAAGLLTSNAWQHVALTYVKASGLAVFYLNGSAVAQQDLGTLAPQTATDFYLGARVAGPGSALYVGQMDEVSLYNRALSASQIQAIYNAGSSGKCPLPPTLLAQPQGAIVPVGGTVSFTALARGTPPLSYQWQLDSDNLKDGGNLFGATSSTLVISNATPANSGTYTLVATNPAGSALSTGAVLTVIDPSGAGKPTVRIVSPANNAYLATAATMVKGTAKGPLGLAQVYYQLNGAGWQLATTTNAWSAWTAPVTVSFGTNLFQVFSVNMVGTPSATNNARFVLGLFAEVAGTYNGLFYDTNGVTPASAGFFTITVTPKGKYTGSLRLAGARYPLSGQFDSDGVSYVSILRQDLSVVSLQLLIDLTQGTDRLTGLVTAGLWAAELAADRAVFDGRTSLAPQAGRYTLIIPGTNSTAGPTGDSYGTLTVDGAGNIRLTASLADGTPLSQAVPVSKNGQWPLYAPLYSGQGLILGWLSFPPGPKDDFKGDVIWIKPTTSKARYYPAGFLIQTTASGSVYSPPGRGTNVLGETSLTLALTGGNLAEGITNQFTLNVNNRVTNHSSNRLSLTFLPSTGSFKGSVVDPVGLKSIPFNGVVLQNRGVGAGYFLGSNRGGQVFIAP
ncbi:MAG: LamG-like jellyroll fold domain-containing protein, partial [Verrucomicrobiota bacterium]